MTLVANTSGTPETPQPRLTDTIALYAKLLPLQKGHRPQTMYLYLHWLNMFVAYVGEDATLCVYTSTRLRQFYNEQLAQKEYAASTRASMVAALRSFGGWLADEEYLLGNPAYKLRAVKETNPVRHLLSEGDSLKILAATNRFPNPRKRVFAKAVLSVLIHGGLRRRELTDLNVSDLILDEAHKAKYHEDKYKLVVRCGKGGKRREVPICDEAVQNLHAWLAIRPSEVDPRCTRPDALFRYTERGSLSDSGLASLVKSCCQLADITYTVTPHSFRHDLATRLLNRTKDYVGVSEILGHAKTSTTLNTYCHTDEGRKRSLADLSGTSHTTAGAKETPPQPSAPSVVPPASAPLEVPAVPIVPVVRASVPVSDELTPVVNTPRQTKKEPLAQTSSDAKTQAALNKRSPTSRKEGSPAHKRKPYQSADTLRQAEAQKKREGNPLPLWEF